MRTWGRSLAVLLVLAEAVLCACGSQAPTAPGDAVAINLTGSGCAPQPSHAPAGTVVFTVTDSAGTVQSEVELHQLNGALIAEQENLVPGLTGGFSALLTQGKYELLCPFTVNDKSTFTVTASHFSWRSNHSLVVAVQSYTTAIRTQAATFSTDTQALAAAIGTGSLTAARAQYLVALRDYERIKAVAEQWLSLDEQIGGQSDDFVPASTFVGLHRIEQGLWQAGSVAGLSGYATKLETDVTTLKADIDGVSLQPDQVLGNAVEMLHEAQIWDLTGLEDAYSGLDLTDLVSNLAGAQDAFSSMSPVVAKSDPTLVKTIRSQWAEINAGISALSVTGGDDGSGLVAFSQVTPVQKAALLTQCRALQTSLSAAAGHLD